MTDLKAKVKNILKPKHTALRWEVIKLNDYHAFVEKSAKNYVVDRFSIWGGDSAIEAHILAEVLNGYDAALQKARGE